MSRGERGWARLGGGAAGLWLLEKGGGEDGRVMTEFEEMED